MHNYLNIIKVIRQESFIRKGINLINHKFQRNSEVIHKD